jgi:3-methylcrotonyl-CoA carboxylase alpha subunit
MIYRYQVDGNIFEIHLDRQGDFFRAIVEGQTYRVEVLDRQPGQISLRLGDRPITLYWAAEGGQKWISREGCTYLLKKPEPLSARSQAEDSAGNLVRSPMPAQVQELYIAEGDQVENGQTILLLEAMKMEIHVRAPKAGRIKKLYVQQDQSVQRDQSLVELEPDEG